MSTNCEQYMHGEIVSLGVLLLLLVDKKFKQVKKVYSFNKSLDLPLGLDDLGVKDIDQIIDLILEDKYLNFAPYTITKKMLKEAISFLMDFKNEKSF